MTLSSIPTAPHLQDPLVESTSGIGDVLVEIEILPEDIAEMEYHLNECPMANMAMDNAIAYALYRIVKPGHRISVSVHRGTAIAKIGDKEFPLADEFTHWLAQMTMGYSPLPIKVKVRLPEVCVRLKIAARSKKLELIQFYKERNKWKAPVAMPLPGDHYTRDSESPGKR